MIPPFFVVVQSYGHIHFDGGCVWHAALGRVVNFEMCHLRSLGRITNFKHKAFRNGGIGFGFWRL